MVVLYVGYLFCALTSYVTGASLPCAVKDYGDGKKVCVCNSTYCDTIEKLPEMNDNEFVCYISSKEGLRFNKTISTFEDSQTASETSIFSWLVGKSSPVTFIVDHTIKYQEFKGYGGAFTDAAGINILSLSNKTQNRLLRSYFSDDGIEYNLCRVPIAGTDFSNRTYSYDDGEADPLLQHFSLATEDLVYKIPLIKRAMDISSADIRLLAGSWSPPTWMKTNSKITGFSLLKEEYYPVYADYMIKFLTEYKKHLITFWALSTGNEPIDGIIPYVTFNSLGWTPHKMAKWVVNYLGPKLANSTHNDTLVVTIDDIRAVVPWWADWMVHADESVLKYMSGFAIHWYMDFLIGDSVVRSLHDKYPDHFIIYSESCTGYLPWDKGVDIGSWKRGEEYMKSIIENTNVWVAGWIDWNLALDLNGGPNWDKNFVDSPILVNASADEFYKQPMFYAMGHVSKFVKPKSVRVDISPTKSSGILATAAKGTDGKIVVVMLNENDSDKKVSLHIPKKGWINKELPAQSFATCVCSVAGQETDQ